MADTIVSTPGNSNDSSGWAVAVIILLVVVVGGFFMLRYGFMPTQTQAPEGGASVQVTLPTAPSQNNNAPKQ